MNKKVSLKTCLLLCAICVLSTMTVFGNATMEEIVAYLNYSIDIVLDGEVKELKDAQGNRVYPISYNGTTYVPIRGVSTLLGVGVEWDSVNGDVILTTRNSEDLGVDLLVGIDEVTSFSYILTPETEKTTRFNEEGSIFRNGLYCSLLSNQDFQVKDFVSIPIDETITKVRFEGYADKKCSINIFNQQGKLLKTFYLQENKLSDFEFEIDSAMNTEIHFVVLSQSNEENINNYARILNIFGR